MAGRICASLSFSFLVLLSLVLPTSAAPTPSTVVARIPYTPFHGPGSAAVIEIPPQAREASSQPTRRTDQPSTWTARDFMSWLLIRAPEAAPASSVEASYGGGHLSVSKRDIFGMDNDKAIRVGTAIIVVIGVIIGLLVALPAIIGVIKKAKGTERSKI